jgi:hypothetical protein
MTEKIESLKSLQKKSDRQTNIPSFIPRNSRHATFQKPDSITSKLRSNIPDVQGTVYTREGSYLKCLTSKLSSAIWDHTSHTRSVYQAIQVRFEPPGWLGSVLHSDWWESSSWECEECIQPASSSVVSSYSYLLRHLQLLEWFSPHPLGALSTINNRAHLHYRHSQMCPACLPQGSWRM